MEAIAGSVQSSYSVYFSGCLAQGRQWMAKGYEIAALSPLCSVLWHFSHSPGSLTVPTMYPLQRSDIASAILSVDPCCLPVSGEA